MKHSYTLLLLILTLLSAGAAAEIFDCTDNLKAYSETVAELNSNRYSVNGSVPGTAVICRTSGEDPVFPSVQYTYGVLGPDNCYLLYFESSSEAETAANELKHTRGVMYAEPDTEIHAAGSSEKAIEIELHSWGAEAMGFPVYLAYTPSDNSKSATVAVIDSGCFPHVLIAPRYISGGYDYIDNDYDCTNDLSGHGTGVCGIIADCTAGHQVYIYPIRVLDKYGGGKMSNLVNAVREATSHGVDIINLSIESDFISEALDDAVTDALNAGITVVVAAGNDNTDTVYSSPAHIDEKGVIVVGSANKDGTKASYSNYGKSVDLYAYGSGISCCSRSGLYTTVNGTSFAAPHISAISALILENGPWLSPAALESRLIEVSGGINGVLIPDVGLLVHREYNFNLTSLSLYLGESLRMPGNCYPELGYTVNYTSSDERIIAVDGCALSTASAGTAVISARCAGMDEVTFTVTVSDKPPASAILPSSLTRVGEGAFAAASSLQRVSIPDGVISIGNNAFSGCNMLEMVLIPESVTSIGTGLPDDVVIVCPQQSEAYKYAENNGYSFILTESDTSCIVFD